MGIDKIPKFIKTQQRNASLSHNSTLIVEAINRQFPVYLEDQYNPKRVHFYEGHFQPTQSDKKFQFPDFNYKKFGNLITDDLAWLSSVTNGKIAYDLNQSIPTPIRSSTPPDASSISNLNRIAVMEQEERQVRIFLDLLTVHDTNKIYRAKQIFSSIHFCQRPSTLKMMYQKLRKRDKLAEAHLALKKYLSLKPDPRLEPILENMSRRVPQFYNFDNWFATDTPSTNS